MGAGKHDDGENAGVVIGTWTKREDKTGEFVKVEVNPRPFKGVRKRKSSTKALEEIVKRLAPAMKRLADR